jgi:hypothetical protein
VDAGEAMDRIALLYDVEHQAAAKGVVGTPAHRALRQAGSAPRVDDVFAWLAERAPYLPPKSQIGKAVRYAQKPEAPLRQFLTDPLQAQALVDRFVNNAHDLVIEGESYRRRQKPARAKS